MHTGRGNPHIRNPRNNLPFALEPLGQVEVHGELWEAHSATPVPRDARVRITAVSGLTLTVEPLPPA